MYRTFDYDSLNNPVKEVWVDWDTETGKVYDSTVKFIEYKYNERGLWVERLEYEGGMTETENGRTMYYPDRYGRRTFRYYVYRKD